MRPGRLAPINRLERPGAAARRCAALPVAAGLPFLLLAGMFALPGTPTYAAATAPPQAAQNPARAKEDLAQLRSRIEALQKQVAGTEETRSEAADQLRESERAISDANRALAQLDQSIAGANKQAQDAHAESVKTGDALAAQQQILAALLRQHYLRNGVHQPEAVRLVLSGANPSTVARDFSYMGYVSRAQGDVIRGMRDNLAALKTQSETAVAKAAEITRLGAEQLNQRTRLQAERAKRATVVGKLATDIQRQRGEISVMQRNETRLASLVEQLARVIASAPPLREAPAAPHPQIGRLPQASAAAGPFSRMRGRLGLPVRGELVSRFGSPRQDGGPPWKGVFVAAAAGEAVHAVAGGRVVYADWLRGFGNLLIMDHGEGYMSLYGYNETLLKQVGDEVGAGDAVATVGNSGGSGESGLYFELRYQGKPFDPLSWVGR